jgi:hypothetical protein
MATAPAPEIKGQVPNFCEPQTTVTIFIAKKSNAQGITEICHKLLSSERGTSNDLATQSTYIPELPKFIIHKNLISHHSPFFSAAFNGNFKEGLSQEMTLEVDLTTFGIFSNWLYTQKILDATGGRPDSCILAHVRILADRFLIPKLQDKVMDLLVDVLILKPDQTKQEYCDFCNVADQHAEGDLDHPLVVLAAAVLIWLREWTLAKYLQLLPRSVFVKSWQLLKTVQIPETTVLLGMEALYVNLPENKKGHHLELRN